MADPLGSGPHQRWPVWQVAGECARLGDFVAIATGERPFRSGEAKMGKSCVISSVDELEEADG